MLRQPDIPQWTTKHPFHRNAIQQRIDHPVTLYDSGSPLRNDLIGNTLLDQSNTELLRYLSIAKEASDLHTNIFSQYLIWDYLEHNEYDAHITRIRELYRKQAQAMMNAMERYFPSTVTYTRPEGGMFLWATLPEGTSALSLFPRALDRKVAFVPGDPFYTDCRDVNTMRLNYTNADCTTIAEGVRRLGEVLREVPAEG